MSDTRARRASRRLASLALALAILPAAGATGTLAASPAVATPPTLAVSTAITPPLGAPATPGAFRINLARGDDYVRQTTFVQCVGASVQMMLNIMDPGADRTRRTQHRLQVQARAWSGPRPDGRTREGAGVFGWAAALNLNDGGPYGVVGADTLGEAMRLAAIAMVEHHRPVGLLVWQGRHAWVMSGFQATGDPRRGDFRVTKAYILDPLHPYGSKVWGPSPAPGAAISVATVGRQFVPRRTGGPWNALPGMAALSGKYVLVVPTDAAPSRLDKADPTTLLADAPSLDPPPAPAPAPAPTTSPSVPPPQARWPLGHRPL